MPKGIKKEAWHKRAEEGFLAHELLMVYISLGGERTPAKVAEASGHSWALCKELSLKFDWESRAAAYDDWMIRIQEKAIESQLAQDGIIFAQRRSQARHREYSLAQKLLDQAEQMLDAPLYLETVTELKNINGQEVAVSVTYTPTKWNKRDAAAFVRVADDIMRLSLEMDTQKIGVTIDMKDPLVRLEMARASYENWKINVDKLVDDAMLDNPGSDRNLVTQRILEALPDWAARDWKLTPEQIPLITQGQDALPLLSGDVVEYSN